MIALTSLAQVLILRSRVLVESRMDDSFWLMAFASTSATLLVMSVLQGNLDELCSDLATREEDARRDALTDSLTRLGNRKYLIEKLEEKVNSIDLDKSYSLLFIDLDHFKRVNDTLGHLVGDELIVQVSERLREIAPAAMIARLGGDEFAIILSTTDASELAVHCSSFAKALAGTYQVGGTEVYVGMSIGAVMFDDGLSPSDLMRRADIAMYKAKSERDDYRIFDEEMIRNVERRGLLETRLRDALKSGNGISAVFLPQVNANEEMIGFEALLRWNDEQFGPIPAIEIISIAEEAGLIADVGLFIAGQACEAARMLPDQEICLNVASRQLLDEGFTEQLVKLVQERGQIPERFQLDIPEEILVKRGEEIRPVLKKLAAAGFKLAADDFGTSTSSLNYLQSLGITAIKLDRSFLQSAVELGTIAVMRAIVGLAKTLNLSVACEGVSTLAEKSAAIHAGCDSLQGFLFGEPVFLLELVAANQQGRRGYASRLAG